MALAATETKQGTPQLVVRAIFKPLQQLELLVEERLILRRELVGLVVLVLTVQLFILVVLVVLGITQSVMAAVVVGLLELVRMETQVVPVFIITWGVQR